MPWKYIICLAICAGLLCGLAACSEKTQIRPQGEVAIGGSVKSHK